MGMSSRVTGFKPPNLKWRQMKAIYDACELADVSIPDEVDRYFEGERPDESGVAVSLTYPLHEAVKEYRDDMEQGYEVDLTKLPPDVKILRFVNSW